MEDISIRTGCGYFCGYQCITTVKYKKTLYSVTKREKVQKLEVERERVEKGKVDEVWILLIYSETVRQTERETETERVIQGKISVI